MGSVNLSEPTVAYDSVTLLETNQHAQQAVENLRAWAQQSGISISKRISVNSTWHGGNWIRGLVAAKDIYKSEVIMQVPRSAWIGYDSLEVLTGVALEPISECIGKPDLAKRLKA